jgi:hypothetical protein
VSIKRAALTLLVAVLCAAAWSLGAITLESACADQADSPINKPERHGDFARGHALDAEGDGRDGSTLQFRFAYDMLDESRLH